MMTDEYRHHRRGSSRVMPDFRSSTPKVKTTTSTPVGATNLNNKSESGLGAPRRGGGNITASFTPHKTARLPPATLTKAPTTASGRNHNHSNSTTGNHYQLHLEAQVAELQNSVSRLALENEELQHELNQIREENEQLHQTLQESEMVQSRTRQQLETVTQAAYTLYEKFRAFKCRYYEEQRLLGG